jgi:hypothetical protein
MGWNEYEEIVNSLSKNLHSHGKISNSNAQYLQLFAEVYIDIPILKIV